MPPRGGPLRLVKTLRGAGELRWGSRQTRPVAYAIDFYSQGLQRSAAGDIRGDFAVIAGRPRVEGRLRLEDGEDHRILLLDVEADSAMVEFQDA
ncbi:MAG TPA: hypothetical protein VG939_20505 [Caulobacteraceae bacterium]|nr:hypothetical protein [Caulobacteraceae bacterium]